MCHSLNNQIIKIPKNDQRHSRAKLAENPTTDILFDAASLKVSRTHRRLYLFSHESQKDLLGNSLICWIYSDGK